MDPALLRLATFILMEAVHRQVRHIRIVGEPSQILVLYDGHEMFHPPASVFDELQEYYESLAPVYRPGSMQTWCGCCNIEHPIEFRISMVRGERQIDIEATPIHLN